MCVYKIRARKKTEHQSKEGKEALKELFQDFKCKNPLEKAELESQERKGKLIN